MRSLNHTLPHQYPRSKFRDDRKAGQRSGAIISFALRQPSPSLALVGIIIILRSVTHRRPCIQSLGCALLPVNDWETP